MGRKCYGVFHFLNFWLKLLVRGYCECGGFLEIKNKNNEVLSVDLFFDCICSLRGKKPLDVLFAGRGRGVEVRYMFV